MCGKKEDEECSQTSIHTLHGYQEQLFLQQQFHHQQQQYNNDSYGGGRLEGGGGGLFFPHQVSSPILPWNIQPVHQTFNPLSHFSNDHHPFTVPPPPLPIPSSSSPYGALFNRRASSTSALQFAYEGASSSDHHHHHLRILSDQLGPVGSSPFGLQAHELGKMTAQEIMDAKALAASKSHSEAERRRRERINNHLAKLRSLLPSTTKTDKASLLQEVIQHVRELKRQTSQIAEVSPVPTENDELIVDASDEEEDGKFIIKASLCCEDRSDLFPELIKTLKALRLRTLKAEITTLGGRVKNVLFITGEDGGKNSDQQQHSISSIQEALKTVMERSGGGGSGDDTSSGSIKRQRTTSMLEQHRSL